MNTVPIKAIQRRIVRVDPSAATIVGIDTSARVFLIDALCARACIVRAVALRPKTILIFTRRSQNCRIDISPTRIRFGAHCPKIVGIDLLSAQLLDSGAPTVGPIRIALPCCAQAPPGRRFARARNMGLLVLRRDTLRLARKSSANRRQPRVKAIGIGR